MMKRRSFATAFVTVCALLVPLAVQAQPISGDGFLFQRPTGSLTLHGGYSKPSASSDAFDLAQQKLTIGKDAFSSVAVSLDYNLWVADRFSIEFGAGYSGRKVPSEYRAFIDNNDKPIQQSTELMRAPFSIGARYYLTSPGRAIGRFAYIPSRISPYVSAGGGAMWYRFKQTGDFIDVKSKNLDVFNGELVSTGWGPEAYGAAGFDLTLHPNVALTTEARYEYARGNMSRDYAGLNRIDLSGLTATVGLTFRY
ncbi:MAG: outer membrane beta-barrel protein [Gemmatimonadota bacterium]|nr:outer membrane beta-barrel protein [Gemmatimonadota bacterium]